MKIHVVTAICVLLLSMFYKLSKTEFLIVCIVIALVIICELFNTAIENIVDIIVDVYHPKAKIIKDAAAGAVFLSAIAAGTVGYFVFFDRVASNLETGMAIIRRTPVHITLIALMITFVSVLILKALSGRRSLLKGGMPSGHAALAFSLSTALGLFTNDARVFICCTAISLLVAQSRLEAKIHSVLELLVGALLGCVITIFLFQLFYF